MKKKKLTSILKNLIIPKPELKIDDLFPKTRYKPRIRTNELSILNNEYDIFPYYNTNPSDCLYSYIASNELIDSFYHVEEIDRFADCKDWIDTQPIVVYRVEDESPTFEELVQLRKERDFREEIEQLMSVWNAEILLTQTDISQLDHHHYFSSYNSTIIYFSKHFWFNYSNQKQSITLIKNNKRVSYYTKLCNSSTLYTLSNSIGADFKRGGRSKFVFIYIKLIKKLIIGLDIYKSVNSVGNKNRLEAKTLDNFKNKTFAKEPQLCDNYKFSYFFSSLFSRLFKSKIYLINYNYFYKTKIIGFHNMVKKLFFRYNFLKKIPYTHRVLKILIASLLFKDSKILSHIIKDMFESVHYSRHRIYFSFWRDLIKRMAIKYYKKVNVRGIKLEFHGKLGVGGNSKKRSYYYTMGRCSNSTKLFKVDSTNSFIWTSTGAVGFTYSIYY